MEGPSSRNLVPHTVPKILPQQPTTSHHQLCSSASSFNNQEKPIFALQWNLRGLRQNINELKKLISDYKPTIVALQETKASDRVVPPDFVGKSYTLLLKSGDKSYWQHGVGIAIHDGTPFERIPTNSKLQVIAVRIHLPTTVTVVSLYIPPSTSDCQDAIRKLLVELPRPLIIMGDTNAHHPAWGSNSTDSLGRFLAEETLKHDLVIMNDGSATRIDPGTGNATAIDISSCSETIVSRLTWRTHVDTCNSDHLPILISFIGRSPQVTTRRKWIYNQAAWVKYEEITANTIQTHVELDIKSFTEKLLAAAKSSIPRTSGIIGPKALPWWSDEVERTVKQRRKALRALRRIHPLDPRKAKALELFTKTRSIARLTIMDAKKKSWELFVDRISPSSTTKEIWDTINALRGKRRQTAAVMKIANTYTDDPEKIAEHLAQHYSNRSATSSYPPLFKIAKEKAEQQCLDSPLDYEAYYNTDFTTEELLWALDKGRSASTGPDCVGYPMLQRLPLSVKKVLLDVLNGVWRSGVFPLQWRTGTIIPIPKTNSTELYPENFRPITLTNCIAKVFERMVNRRLISELDANGRIDRRQHAFRPGQGTDSYFVELEKCLPNNGEHCLMASLDLAKAYDTTWRFSILRTLKTWKIEGRMFKILQSFLSERSFQVSVAGFLSRTHILENGTPQGSVLSVTLFLIAMQPIFRIVPPTVNVVLYADDILLAARSKKNKTIHRKLQSAVKAVNKWANSVGFTISAEKSKIFYCSPNVRQKPPQNIKIDSLVIPRTKQLKILGVTLDRLLNFRRHCELTKKICKLRLRILKILGGRLKRAHRTRLLQVGSAIVTTRLLYGIGLVSKGGMIVDKILAPIYNKTIRYASGAFVTSPITAIMAEAGTLPFNLVIIQHVLRIAIHMLAKGTQNNELPLIERAIHLLDQIMSPSESTSSNHTVHNNNRQGSELTLIGDVPRCLDDPPAAVGSERMPNTQASSSTSFYFGQTTDSHCFSDINPPARREESDSRRTIPNISPIIRGHAREWHKRSPSIIWDIRNRVRAGDPAEKVRPIVQELLSSKFPHSTIVFTDGSKDVSSTGVGIFGLNTATSICLPKQCSIFSAEAYAIKTAMNMYHGTESLLILTDSASCLSAIESGRSKHPWIQQIENAANLKQVLFCWIPGHAGITGNEHADKLANEARRNEPVNIPIPADDVIKFFNAKLRDLWSQTWFASRDVKLREIKADTYKWIDCKNPSDQRVLTRLRIGHTRLTHAFLLKKEAAPLCDTCGTVFNIHHLLTECLKYDSERKNCDINSLNLAYILNNEPENEKKLIKFLKNTRLYNKL